MSIPRLPNLGSRLDVLDSLIAGVLCLGVVRTQNKFEVTDKEGERAARMIDEKWRRGYDRAGLPVSTTRCSPSAADPSGQTIGGPRSGAE
jgi:hypothetical protein